MLYRLRDAGFSAYLVGGAVRDLLVGQHPKDFDVATDATPEQVKQQFRNCRLIGRRFRLAHVVFGREIIEVATFRANSDDGSGDREMENGMLVRDNVYGTIEDDAVRRDFTCNALYYAIEDFSVRDYTGGFEDVQARLMKLIGDPEQRYREDPVRMLRAVRFAAKLDFGIEKHTFQPIRGLAPMLREIPPARLFEECLKLFLSGQGAIAFEMLVDLELFEPLFPASAHALDERPTYTHTLISQALNNTDLRVKQGKPVTPAFLFAALLWPALPARVLHLQNQGVPPIPAMNGAAHDLIAEQCARIAIPKRFTLPIREIWDMQERLPRRSGKRADMLLDNPRFRAGYDFLLLRESAGEETDDLGQWWTDYQDANDSERREMIRELGNRDEGTGAGPRKRKRSGSKRKRGGDEAFE